MLKTINDESPIRIVDAQVHAWANGESTGHHRRTPITAAVLKDEMAKAGVDRVVLVPPLWDPEGNEYSMALAQADPDRFAVMGVPEPGAAGLERHLRRCRGQAGMKGIRFLFNSKERLAPLLAGEYDAFWPVAEESGMVVALLIPGALQEAERIATRHPKLKLIVDHLGVPRGASGPGAFEHLPQLLAMARHPNVYVKAVGVGDYALDPYPFRSLEPVLRQVVDTFGAQRVIWGSDLSRLHHPYRQCVTHFCETLSWLSRDELADIMGGNVCRLLDWP
jgi:L-fuconolactonase